METIYADLDDRVKTLENKPEPDTLAIPNNYYITNIGTPENPVPGGTGAGTVQYVDEKVEKVSAEGERGIGVNLNLADSKGPLLLDGLPDFAREVKPGAPYTEIKLPSGLYVFTIQALLNVSWEHGGALENVLFSVKLGEGGEGEQLRENWEDFPGPEYELKEIKAGEYKLVPVYKTFSKFVTLSGLLLAAPGNENRLKIVLEGALELKEELAVTIEPFLVSCTKIADVSDPLTVE